MIGRASILPFAKIPASGRAPISPSTLPYWTQQKINDSCLFFASHPTDLLSKVVATQLLNQVTGAVDYLTVTGVGLDARYRTPDSDTYRTADLDYVFWKSDASESVCDGNRLIGYDFPHIIIKYLNVAPYTILWIAILKPGVTVTNGMRDAFDLSMWWDNTLSLYGNLKGNRGTGQSVWPPVDVSATALINRMIAEGEEPTAPRKAAINTAITALKAAGLFDTQFDTFVVTRGHGAASTKMNWIGDVYNPEAVNSPVFTADSGYDTGGAMAYLKTNFAPLANAGNLYKQDDACFLIKYAGASYGAGMQGCYRADFGNRLTLHDGYSRINCSTSDGLNASPAGYLGLSREASTDFQTLHNASINTTVATSLDPALPEAYILAVNPGGGATLNMDTGILIELYAFGKHLSQADFLVLQTIMNAYFASF